MLLLKNINHLIIFFENSLAYINIMNASAVIDSSIIGIDENAQYQLWALLVMQGLLVLERIFKNSKVFCKCTKDGCTLTNRTPPQSPEASQSIEKPNVRKNSKPEAVNMQDVINALEKLKESHETLTASISSRNAISEESLGEYVEWKKHKDMKRELEKRERKTANSHSLDKS